jgi:lysophospholipase L1-like esterase
MQKKIFLGLFLVLCFGFCLLYQNNLVAKANEQTSQYNVLILGDSIAAGFVPDSLLGDSFYEAYQNYVNGTAQYTVGSYGHIFSQRYHALFGQQNTSVVSKAVSGHDSSDLLELLNAANPNNILSQIQNTDAIVLCIGANNILRPMFANLDGFLAGNVDITEIEQIINLGVQTFYSDMDEIMATFLQINPNIKIYPMTIYSPYKFVDLTEITVMVNNSDYTSFLLEFLSDLNNDFQILYDKAMQGLNQIHNHILANTYNNQKLSDNVVPVDVRDEFDKLSREEYPNYVYANTSTMVIELTQSQALSIFMGDYSVLVDAVMAKTNLDPHPTLEGHAKIAQIYKNSIHDLYLKSSTSLNTSTRELESFWLSYDYIGEGNLTFVLEKMTDSQSTQVSVFETNQLTLSVSDFIGTGELVVVGYNQENEIVCISNSIEYNIIDNKVDESVEIVSFTGVTSGDISNIQTITINVEVVSNFENVTIKVFKSVQSVETEIDGQWIEGSFTISTAQLVGQNVNLYVKAFNGEQLLSTSNPIVLNFVENTEQETPPEEEPGEGNPEDEENPSSNQNQENQNPNNNQRQEKELETVFLVVLAGLGAIVLTSMCLVLIKKLKRRRMF